MPQPEPSRSSIAISVIVCTYNRGTSLEIALRSLAASTLPASFEWEVLVVDNNSNDETRRVAEDCCSQYPGRFRYVFEPNPGKSLALNRGIREARGEILAFVDDDVAVEPTWLQNLTARLHTDEWAGAGGRILPNRDFVRPAWLPVEGRYALAPLALFDRGLQDGQLAESPFGTNMAYRRGMFDKHGAFRTDLGPKAGSSIPQKSEDAEFGNRLLAAGERFRYEPSAVVYHEIPESRLKTSYFLDWWFDKSRSDIRAFGVPTDTRWFIAGVPAYMFRRIIVWSLRWMTAFEPSRRFSSKIKTWTLLGAMLECYRHWRFGLAN